MKANGQYEGPITIDRYLEFDGQIIGDLTVAPGGEVVLNGQVTGNVIIDEGGVLTLHGMVVGKVINNGGTLAGGGMVIGRTAPTRLIPG